VTRQAINRLRKKYGIDILKEKKEERNKAIKAMHKKGKKISEIAKKFDMSTSWITQILLRK
jgi:Mor family transcriptional regulator